MRKLIITALLIVGFMMPAAVLACSGAGTNKHIGIYMGMDDKKNTFTIKDAESSSPITFTASKEILKSLKGFKGRVLVSYEEDVAGDLKAIGVTF